MRHTVTVLTQWKRSRLFRCALAGVLAIVVLFLPAKAALSAPQWCVPAGIDFATQDSVMVGEVVSRFDYFVPVGVSSVAGGATVTGNPAWALFMGNHTASPVTDPTFTVSSGLDPALFNSLPTATFPTSCSAPSLGGDGQRLAWGNELAATGIQSTFALGYDASWSASQVPAGGGDVTVAFSITFTNPRFVQPGIFIGLSGPGTIVSMASPANANQGENTSAGGGVWTLYNGQLNKTYVFSAVVHVDNPAATPLAYAPGAQLYGGSTNSSCSVCGVTGSSVSVPEPLLDGSQPNSGAFTFSIDQTGSTWMVFPQTQYDEFYSGGLSPVMPTSIGQCKKGGWQTFGVFKNQGDCVSYVATGGKNPPNG